MFVIVAEGMKAAGGGGGAVVTFEDGGLFVGRERREGIFGFLAALDDLGVRWAAGYGVARRVVGVLLFLGCWR